MTRCTPVRGRGNGPVLSPNRPALEAEQTAAQDRLLQITDPESIRPSDAGQAVARVAADVRERLPRYLRPT